MSRSEQIVKFLENAGWGGATIAPLAGDASFRRYDRILKDGKQAVLMDAPPEFEDTRPFVAVAEFLFKSGLNAPEIFAKDFENGFLLLGDLGDNLFKTVLEQEPGKELSLYKKAVDELVVLNKQIVPRTLPYGEGEYPVPTNDMATLIGEISLLTDWYYPALTGQKLSFEKREYFLTLWEGVLRSVSEARECLVLRDYHAENLLELDDGKVGQLDFQDAVLGHSAYDLVSLLQDARRDVDPIIERKMISYFANELGREENQFSEDYSILGAQRNIKIIGIFARLFVRDGKDNYLKLIPRVWGLLERSLEHPRLHEIKRWLDTELPEKRIVPLNPIETGPSHSMILAAGLGKRMKPLTNDRPKPLIDVRGKAMLGHTLDAIAHAGIKHTVINKHHFSKQIDAYIDKRRDWRPIVTFSDESDELLDSGGGVKKALPMLGDKPFFILNSDMIWKNNGQDALHRLATAWNDDMDVLLLLINHDDAYGHEGPGDFFMDDENRLTFRGDAPKSDYFYGGILIIRPECFDGVDEKIFSLRKIFRTAAANGRLFGLPHEGSWYHVGTPNSVHETEQLLKGK